MPRKTALSWIRRRARAVDTLDEQSWAPAYHVRIANLERRVAMLCNPFCATRGSMLTQPRDGSS